MGLFSLFKKRPKRGNVAPPKYKTAQEIFNEAIGFAKANFGQAYGAREGALSDLALGPAYYEKFSPTSFEQALGNQYFQNTYPDVEKTIKGALSASGLAYSPILAEQLGKAHGNLSFDIGSYLSNLGNERARYSLNQRLGIDPYETFSPYAETDIIQSNKQAQADYENRARQVEIDFENAISRYQKQEEAAGLVGSLIGAGVGGYFGGGSGALLGGSGLGTLVGGAENAPLSFSDALTLSSLGSSGQYAIPGFQGYGRGAPAGTFNAGNISILPGKAQPVYSLGRGYPGFDSGYGGYGGFGGYGGRRRRNYGFNRNPYNIFGDYNFG